MLFYFTSVPSSAPQQFSGYVINSTAVSLSWAAIPKENQNGIIRYYLVDVLEQDTGTSLEYISATEEIIIHPLHPYYSYSFRVAGVTVDTGLFSGSLSFLTHQDSKHYYLRQICEYT